MLDIGIRIAIENVAETVRGVQQVGNQVQASMGKAQNSTNGAGSAFRSLRAELPALDRGLRVLANPIVAMALAVGTVTAAFGDAISVARDFEKQVADAGAIITTGLDTGEAQRQIAALREEAERLGASTEFSATQSAAAIEFLGRAGFTTQEILARSSSGVSALESTLALATVGNLELARAADISSNVLSQFNKESTELASVVDIIAKTTTSANTNVEQFANALNFIGPTAAALNITLEETSAAVGILGNSGLQGSLATRALGTSLVNLTKPTRAAADEIARIGLEAFDAQGNFIGIAGLVGQLEQAYVGFTAEQRQASLATIFGAEAIQEMNILLSAGSEEIRAYTQEIEAAGAQQGGFSAQIRDTKLDTYQGSLQILRSAFEGLQIALADGALPVLKEVNFFLADTISVVTGLAKGTTSLGEVFGPIGEALERFGAAAGELGGALASAFSNVDGFETVLGYLGRLAEFTFVNVIDGITSAVRAITGLIQLDWGAWLSDNAAILGSIVVALIAFNAQLIASKVALIAQTVAFEAAVIAENIYFALKGGITKAVQLLTVAQQALNAVMRANPIGFVVGLVATLAAGFLLLYNRSEELRAGVAGTFEAIKQVLMNFARGALDVLKGVGNVLVGVFTLDMDLIRSGLEQYSEGLKGATFGIGEGVADAFNAGYEAKIANEERARAIQETMQEAAVIPEITVPPIDVAEEVITDAKGVGRNLGQALGEGVKEGLQFSVQALALNIPAPEITLPDISTQLAEGVEAINPEDTLRRWTELADALGVSLGFLQDNFDSTREVADLATSGMYKIAEAFGLAGEDAIEFSKSLEELGKKIEEELVEGAVRSVIVFGEELGKAVAQGEKIGNAFEAFLRSLAQTVLVEVPKLVGLFLLQTAVGLGFPAGIPAAIGGIALLGFSGFAAGLLSGRDRGPEARMPESSVGPRESRAAADRAGEQYNQYSAFGEPGEPAVNTTVVVNIEAGGVAREIQRYQERQEELTRGR